MRSRRHLAHGLIACLFIFATGAAGLIYQVCFATYLARMVGGDHLATSVTLATFLAGLAIGYAACGRLTLAVRNHLFAYAVIELFIALWAVCFPRLADVVFALLAGWSGEGVWLTVSQSLLAGGLLVLPPSLLMGATVPFLTRGLARSATRLSETHAALYGLNTAGACAGALAAGFALLPRFGLATTMRGTACINAAAALAFFVLSRFDSESAGIVRSDNTPATTPAHATDPTRAAASAPVAAHAAAGRAVQAAPARSMGGTPPAVLYWVVALNGLAVLLLEACIIRLAKLTFGGTVTVFSMVVAVFVVCLAIGAFIVARRPQLRVGSICAAQWLAAISLLLLYPTIDSWPYYTHILRLGFQATASGFVLFQIATFLCLLGVLLVPVGLLGMTLPLAYRELHPSLSASGWGSGRLLAWNGLGTLAGSLLGGFVLFQWLGLGRVYLCAPLIASATAVLLVGRIRVAARLACVALMLAAALTLAVRPVYDPTRFAFGLYRLRAALPFSFAGADVFFREMPAFNRVIALEEDPQGLVAVIDSPADGEHDQGSRALLVNGKSESDTKGDAVTLRLLAHLPALWAPSRERSLVIGLGTGVTAGEMGLYPDARSIEVAEISPAVERCLPLFDEFNRGIRLDPRLHVRRADALRILRGDAASSPGWDLIVSEPSNPWVAGADVLFTTEFYELVRGRLSEDGVFVQWVQLYESDFELLGMVLNSLHSVFPAVHAFNGTKGDLILLARERPFTREDRERAERVLAASPAVGESLVEIGLPSVQAVLDREVNTLPTLLLETQRYGLSTMDLPRLHYLGGRAVFTGTSVGEEELKGGQVNLEFLWSDEFQRMKGD